MAKPRKLNKEKIMQYLREDKIKPYVNDIAKACKVNWHTANRFVKENPDVRELMEERKMEVYDIAEKGLESILLNPEHPEYAKMIKWLLATTQKFSEKTEQKQDGTITITIKKPDDNK